MLASHAEDHDVGLIVMTTHGRGGLRRAWLISVRRDVARYIEIRRTRQGIDAGAGGYSSYQAGPCISGRAALAAAMSASAVGQPGSPDRATPAVHKVFLTTALTAANVGACSCSSAPAVVAGGELDKWLNRRHDRPIG